MNKKPMATELRLGLVLIPLMVVLSVLSPRFLTVDNLTNVVWSVCLIGILSSGAIYPRITGGIDLSLGSTAALTGIVVDLFMNRIGMPWIPAILMTIVIGALVGLFNGFIVAKIKVPAFVVTMAAKTYLYGIALVVSRGPCWPSSSPSPSSTSARDDSSGSRTPSTSWWFWPSRASSYYGVRPSAGRSWRWVPTRWPRSCPAWIPTVSG